MAASKRREYHHGDLRAALLKTATELVRTRGVAAFSLREASREVGVDPAATYRHFSNRQAVLVAIAQQGFAQLARKFAKDRARGLSPRDTLTAFGQSYIELGLKEPELFRVMFGESGWSARDPRLRLPEVSATAYEQLEQVCGEVVGAKDAVPAAQLANAMWASAHGVTRLVIDGALPMDKRTAAGLIELLVDALLRSVAPERSGV